MMVLAGIAVSACIGVCVGIVGIVVGNIMQRGRGRY